MEFNLPWKDEGLSQAHKDFKGLIFQRHYVNPAPGDFIESSGCSRCLKIYAQTTEPSPRPTDQWTQAWGAEDGDLP